MKLPEGWQSSIPILRKLVEDGAKDEGDYLTFPNGRRIKIATMKPGYRCVKIYRDYKNKRHRYATIKVSRIVCWIAHGPPDNQESQCDHINRNKADDRPENLRWFTQSENSRNVSEDYIRRRADAVRRNAKHGSASFLSKMKDNEAKECIRLRSLNEVKIGDLAKKYGVHRVTVSRIVNGKTWRYLDRSPTDEPVTDERK